MRWEPSLDRRPSSLFRAAQQGSQASCRTVLRAPQDADSEPAASSAARGKAQPAPPARLGERGRGAQCVVALGASGLVASSRRLESARLESARARARARRCSGSAGSPRRGRPAALGLLVVCRRRAGPPRRARPRSRPRSRPRACHLVLQLRACPPSTRSAAVDSAASSSVRGRHGEQLVPRTALALGQVHRLVGVAHQVLGRRVAAAARPRCRCWLSRWPRARRSGTARAAPPRCARRRRSRTGRRRCPRAAR